MLFGISAPEIPAASVPLCFFVPQRGRQVGDRCNKIPFLFAEGMRPIWQSARGRHCPWSVTRAVGEGFYSFLLALSCSPLAAAHPKLAAAKGEQDRTTKFNPRACAQSRNCVAGPQGPSRMPCRPEFGEDRTLSRIATAGTYARQRQKGVPSYGCQYTEQPSQHWPKDP